MDDFLVFFLVLLWIVAIIGGPAAFLAWQSHKFYDTPRHYKVSRSLRGWLIGGAVSIVLIVLLPPVVDLLFFVSQMLSGTTISQNPSSDNGLNVQLLMALIFPPVFSGLGFLGGILWANKFQPLDEYEYEEEEDYVEGPGESYQPS